MTSFFLWGSATSAHQVEGQNIHNDWWAWEQAKKVQEPSGPACDHYRRYPEDFEIISNLGHNAHRFSIEWSRLEPRENEWDPAAFEHYHQVLSDLNRRGIEPMVTLHHFTIPQWFAALGGWESDQAAYYFSRFVNRVVQNFAHQVKFWVTINEPLVYLYFSYLEGTWPPGKNSIASALKVLYQLIKGHISAYDLIHRHYQEEGKGPVWVSIAKHLSCFTPARPHHLLDRYSVWLRNWFFNDMLLNALTYGFLFFPGVFCEWLPRSRSLDFIGVNYYTRDFIRFGGWGLRNSLGQIDSKSLHPDEVKEQNQMGWEVYPDGLYKILMRLRRYRLPLIITENGICTEQDTQRGNYIQDHLKAVERAKAQGADVRGYFYWSLLDNFEWAHGFRPRFGIVGVDYVNQQRIIRNSAKTLSEMCRKLV